VQGALNTLAGRFSIFRHDFLLEYVFFATHSSRDGISYRYEEIVSVHFRRVDTVKHVVTRDSPRYRDTLQSTGRSCYMVRQRY